MIKRFTSILSVLLFSLALAAQTDALIEQMEQERREVEERLSESQRELTGTESDIALQISQLNRVEALLKERRALLAKTKSDIRELDRQTALLESEIETLQRDYEECAKSYADACRFFQKQRTSFSPITFLFSSSTFRELTRRMRYISEYTSSLEELAEQIEVKRRQLLEKMQTIQRARGAKVALQLEQQRNEAKVATEERRQRTIVANLQKRRSALKSEISKQQSRIAELNREIERQIAAALKEQSSGKTETGVRVSSEEEIKLTGSFESNKGKLPIPVTGSYLVVGNYGVQNVAGMRDVKLNNLGIDIQGGASSKARSIFDGVVTTVFQQGKGQYGVLVRHGKYISVYCNLSTIDVKKGDEVKTGSIIGDIQTNTSGDKVLHFQLHRETKRLNPSEWIRR